MIADLAAAPPSSSLAWPGGGDGDSADRWTAGVGALGFIPWSEVYATGIAALDAEHRFLFTFYNMAIHAIRSGQGGTLAGMTVDHLLSHTRAHFVHEEDAMRWSGYPGLARHKARHDACLAALGQLEAAVGERREGFDTVARFVAGWLLEHVATEDLELGIHLALFSQRGGALVP